METIAFHAEDGSQLLVRVSSSAQDQEEEVPVILRGGHVRHAFAEAQTSFEAALDPIRVVAQGVLGRIAELPRSPDEVTVEFGLELSARAGAVLAAAGSSAQLRISLTWQPPGHPAGGTQAG